MTKRTDPIKVIVVGILLALTIPGHTGDIVVAFLAGILVGVVCSDGEELK